MTLTLTPRTEARLLAEADRRGVLPDAVIDALLTEKGAPENSLDLSPDAEEKEQTRLRNALAQLRQEALTLVSDPPDSPTRAAARPSAMGKYAGVPGTSHDFALEKRNEIAREERHR